MSLYEIERKLGEAFSKYCREHAGGINPIGYQHGGVGWFMDDALLRAMASAIQPTCTEPLTIDPEWLARGIANALKNDETLLVRAYDVSEDGYTSTLFDDDLAKRITDRMLKP